MLTTCSGKQAGISLGRYGGDKHTTPDTSDLLRSSTDVELELQIFKLQRPNHDNDDVETCCGSVAMANRNSSPRGHNLQQKGAQTD